MSVRVKICGITNRDDALHAVDSGADALGFVFCEASPRQISLDAAAGIIRALPPLVSAVGLFVNASEEFVRRAIERTGIDTLQLHGDETPEFCRRFGMRIIKAFRMRDESSLRPLPKFHEEAWLLDSYVPGKLGGTGELFNWELACRAAQLGQRIILAGGLTPGNVAEAVQRVHPYAVDVSSGVEATPGRKDRAKVRSFIQAAKGG